MVPSQASRCSRLVTASLAVPFGPSAAPLRFAGDLVLVAYLLGAARFFTVIAALDTGSAFEGMGASREVLFSALAEPALFLAFLALAKLAGVRYVVQTGGSSRDEGVIAAADEYGMVMAMSKLRLLHH